MADKSAAKSRYPGLCPGHPLSVCENGDLISGNHQGPPKGPLPVNIVDAAKTFEQCSRGAPMPTGPPWLPSSSEIAAFEQVLLTYIETLGDTYFIDPRWSVSAYRGQYVGFGEGNAKYIYGSYTNADPTAFFASGEPIVLCDGGPSSWGILYNIENGQFSGGGAVLWRAGQAYLAFVLRWPQNVARCAAVSR